MVESLGVLPAEDIERFRTHPEEWRGFRKMICEKVDGGNVPSRYFKTTGPRKCEDCGAPVARTKRTDEHDVVWCYSCANPEEKAAQDAERVVFPG